MFGFSEKLMDRAITLIIGFLFPLLSSLSELMSILAVTLGFPVVTGDFSVLELKLAVTIETPTLKN